SMYPALKAKSVDGYATSQPYTSHAVANGAAVLVASSTFDAPELFPFAYGLIYTCPGFCTEKRDMCARVVRAYQGAVNMIHEQPDKAFAILKKRFARLDPKLLATAWKIVRSAHAKDIRVTEQQLVNSQKVSLDAKLLAPEDALKSYDGLFTDEFVK